MSLAEMLLRDELRREPETPGEVKRLLDAINRPRNSGSRLYFWCLAWFTRLAMTLIVE